jgi:hypothetical protein
VKTSWKLIEQVLKEHGRSAWIAEARPASAEPVVSHELILTVGQVTNCGSCVI